MSTDRELKITMYKALRTIKDKIDKGQLFIMGADSKIDIKEQIFVITRLVNAIAIANQDSSLQEIKNKLDESSIKI